MKTTNLCAKILLALTLTCGAVNSQADQPTDLPPRGRAYGYYLKDGGQVMFLYMESDGTRLIELRRCRLNREYAIEATQDLANWTRLTVLRIGSDGRASFHDTAPLPHRYYRVIRVR